MTKLQWRLQTGYDAINRIVFQHSIAVSLCFIWAERLSRTWFNSFERSVGNIVCIFLFLLLPFRMKLIIFKFSCVDNARLNHFVVCSTEETQKQTMKSCQSLQCTYACFSFTHTAFTLSENIFLLLRCTDCICYCFWCKHILFES